MSPTKNTKLPRAMCRLTCMRTLEAINSVLSVLAYTILAIPFVGMAIAVVYGLAKHTLHLL